MKRIMNKIDYDFWWEKIADYAKLVGRTTARPVLLLYYVLRSPETPSSDKMLIVAALSYLIPEIESEVDNILERWFPEVKYELIQE